MFRITSAVALFMIAIPSIGSAQVTAQLKASRTSGVAPFVVLFDAQGTTHANGAIKPFHDMVYSFSFGEKAARPGYAEVWGNASVWGGQADEFIQKHGKDEYFGGPIAGHVYERPGTYTASVTARDANGATNTKSIQITVQDPNVVFGGANTICIRASASGSFDGCPAGAQQFTNGSAGSAFGAATTGKRVLLRRGDTFSGAGSIRQQGPGIVGAFGNGLKPVIAGTTDPNSTGDAITISSSDWRVMDLRVNLPLAPSTTLTTGIQINASGAEHVLLFRDEVYGGAGSIVSANARGIVQNHVVECVMFPNITSNNTVASLATESDRSFVAGNLIGPSFNHHTRNFGASGSAFQFNKFTGRHAKDRTTFIVSSYLSSKGATRGIVVGYNRWDDTTFNPGAFSGTTDAVNPGEFFDAVLEGNFLGRQSQHFSVNLVQRATIRNNVWHSSGSSPFIEIQKLPASGVTRDIFLSNNTCVSNGNPAECLKVRDNTITNVQARGNLLYAPNTTSANVLVGGFGVNTDNVAVGSNGTRPIVSSNPVRFEDYKTTAGARAGAGLGQWAGIFSSTPVLAAPSAPVLLSVTPVQ